MTRNKYLKGITAGFVATIVISALMLMKQMMDVMPQLDTIGMLTKMAGASTPAVGWAVHFLIGAVLWGLLFARLDSTIPGKSYWLKGVVFGIGAWILMMIVVMPMAGVGLFGVALGMMAPIMTLILHIIFGAVLGGVYGVGKPASVHQGQI